MQIIKKLLEKAGITYFYTLIDDAVARVIKQRAALYGHVKIMMEMLWRHGFFCFWFTCHDDFCFGFSKRIL